MALYVLKTGITHPILKWLIFSNEYHYPCTKCSRITELKRFPYFLWAKSSLAEFPDDTRVKQSHQEIFDSLVCGKCFTTEHPGYCTNIGTPSHDECMIKCLEWDMINVIPADQMSVQMIMSAFCDKCFKKMNHQWFDYKKFLQDS